MINEDVERNVKEEEKRTFPLFIFGRRYNNLSGRYFNYAKVSAFKLRFTWNCRYLNSVKVSAFELREMCRHMNYVKAIFGSLPPSEVKSEFEQRENREEVRPSVSAPQFKHRQATKSTIKKNQGLAYQVICTATNKSL
jgi:hypothetical protein